jgi:pimeloyl-ACP methyl ester carboxylesterase
MKFASAYDFHNNVLAMAQEVVSGRMPKMRPEALIFGYRQLLNGWTVMDRLSEIQMPTLVLAGRYDFLFPTEHQAALAAAMANARLEIIESAGHNPHMERTAEVIQAILEFMSTANMQESHMTAHEG